MAFVLLSCSDKKEEYNIPTNIQEESDKEEIDSTPNEISKNNFKDRLIQFIKNSTKKNTWKKY